MIALNIMVRILFFLQTTLTQSPSPVNDAPCPADQNNCPNNSYCYIYSESGWPYCAQSCELNNGGCGTDQCVMVTVQCITAPCPPVVQCCSITDSAADDLFGGSRGTTSATLIFSFETPSRRRNANDSHRGARELLREITESNSVSTTPRPGSTSSSLPQSQGGSSQGGQPEVTGTATEGTCTPRNASTNTSSTTETEGQAGRGSSLGSTGVSKVKEEEDTEWNYLASFDDVSNKDFNALLIRNVLSVTEGTRYDFNMVKRAARTFFKTRKSAEQRKRTGKEKATATSARRRQRKHNKAHARLKALNLSTTLTAEEKERVRPVLTVKFMSSDESDEEVGSQVAESSESDCENPEPEQAPRKKQLIRHRLPWRSRELQLTFDSLDRKLTRRSSDKAKSMCLKVTSGSDSKRPVPDNSPDWAIELFS